MNDNVHQHEPHDDADFLFGALHGAADAMPGGETEEMHLQFGVVRDRIRRRRVAKAGGTGVAALAVVGVLALGATRLTTADDVVLPADPSPSVSAAEPSPRGTGDPSPSASSADPERSLPSETASEPPSGTASPDAPTGPETSDAFRAGYAPGDIYEDTGLVCGAASDELVEGSRARAVEFDGDPFLLREGDTVTPYATLAVRAADGPATIDVPPAAAWIRDGEVVNLSRYFDAEPPLVEVDDDGVARTDLRLDTVDACSPPPGADDQLSHEPVMFAHVLPAGEYQVVPVVWSNTSGDWTYVSGGPTTVEVLDDGSIGGLEVRR